MVSRAIDALRSVYRRFVPQGLRRCATPINHFVGRLATDESFRREMIVAWRCRLARPVLQVKTPHGPLFVDLRCECVGRPLFNNGEYEPCETLFLRKILRPGLCFCDIGANIGYYTVLGSLLVGKSGRVLAFEPDPHNYSILKSNIVARRLGNVSLFNQALGDNEGKTLLFRSGSNFGDHRLYDSAAGGRATVPIQIRRLDDVLEQGRCRLPDVIKMDVQGYEGLVFRGMKSLLSLPRPLTILAEYWPHGLSKAGSSGKEMYALLLECGFRSYLLGPESMPKPATWSDLEAAISLQGYRDLDDAFVNVVFMKGMEPADS
jgi:FkbM family methyltransferase